MDALTKKLPESYQKYTTKLPHNFQKVTSELQESYQRVTRELSKKKIPKLIFFTKSIQQNRILMTKPC